MMIAIPMIPWMLYSYSVTSKPLVTSTNGGHVLFIGLGQLPGNKWGITPSDSDPLMHSLLKDGQDETCHSCSYEADRVLKKEFLNRIKSDPGEFGKKILHSLKQTTTGGAYPGEFLATDQFLNASAVTARLKQALLRPSESIQEHGLDGMLRVFALGASYAMSIFIVLVSTILVPINGIYSVWKGDLRAMLVVAVLSYNLLLQCCAFQLLPYSNAMLIFHVVNIGLFIGLVFTKPDFG